jgi:WD40 repeat protein
MKKSRKDQLIQVEHGSVAGYIRDANSSPDPFVLKHRYNTRTHSVRSVTVSPDGNYLVITNTDNPKIRVVDLERLEYLPHKYKGHHDTVRLVSFASDGLTFVTASWDCSVRQFQLHSGRCLKKFSGFGKSPSVFMDPAGNYVFNASYDSYIDITKTNTGRCFDISTMEAINSYPHKYSKKNPESIDIAYDQEYCYTGSDNGAAYKWPLLGKVPVLQYFNSEGAGIRKIAVTGKYFAAACTDGRIRLFLKRTGEHVYHFVHTNKAEALDIKISKDETRLYSCGSDGTLKCFDLLMHKTIFHRKVHRKWIWGIHLMNEDRMVVSGSTDGTVAFTDHTGQLQARLHNLVENEILISCPASKAYPRFFYTSNRNLISIYKEYKADKKREEVEPTEKNLIENYISRLNQKNLVIRRLKDPSLYEKMIENYVKQKKDMLNITNQRIPKLLNS